MEEKRQPTVRAAIERGRKQLNALRMMLVGVFISRALGVIVGLLILAFLVVAIGLVVYLTFKRWCTDATYCANYRNRAKHSANAINANNEQKHIALGIVENTH
jgi:hypothetical protein